MRYSYLGETNHQNWRLGFRHGMVPGGDEPGVSGQPQFVRMLVLPRFVGHQNQMEQESTCSNFKIYAPEKRAVRYQETMERERN